MIWFEYEYITLSEIINNIKLLTQYSYLEYLILFISLIVLILTIYYIIPIFNTYTILRKEEIIKEKRKKLLKQIVMQKNINEEIENEINKKVD